MEERLQTALDALGEALAAHGHVWTKEQRALYEHATRRILKLSEE